MTKDEKIPVSGIQHHFLSAVCVDLEVLENKYNGGGQKITDENVVTGMDCVKRCLETANCVSVNYKYSRHLTRCWLNQFHTLHKTLDVQSNSGSTHYKPDKKNCASSKGKVTIVPHLMVK